MGPKDSTGRFTLYLPPVRAFNQALRLAAGADSLYIADSFSELDRYEPGGRVVDSRKSFHRQREAHVDGRVGPRATGDLS
jgi:hypothetical protein